MSYLLSTEALIDTISKVSEVLEATKDLSANETAACVVSFAVLRANARTITDPTDQASWLEAIQDYEDGCFARDTFRDIDIEVAREYSLISTEDMFNSDGELVSAEDRLVIATAMTKSLVLICRPHTWARALMRRGLQVKFY